MSTDGCEGQENEINYLEHVQLVLSMSYTKRGAISIDLYNPSGITLNPYPAGTEGGYSLCQLTVYRARPVYTSGQSDQALYC